MEKNKYPLRYIFKMLTFNKIDRLKKASYFIVTNKQ